VVVDGSVPNDWPAIERALSRCRGRKTAAIEACGGWPWLAYGLAERGVDVHLVHPPSSAPYRQGRAKTDRIDAALLATFAAEPWRVTGSWLCPADHHALRSVLRTQRELVRLRVSMKNRVHGLLIQMGCLPPVTDVFGVAGRAWLAGLDLRAGVRRSVDALVAVVALLDEEAAGLEGWVWRRAKESTAVTELAALAQVGPITALAICLESGDVARFRSADAYCAHCGLVPRVSESGGKRRRTGLSRKGRPALKEAYCEWAYRLLVHGGGPADLAAGYADRPLWEARIILARKLAGGVRAMLARGEDWDWDRLRRTAAAA
jgi:transposase